MTQHGNSPHDAAELAGRVADIMASLDRVGRRLGMQLEEIRPGYARVAMTVTPDMINGHDICHGGYTFTLADTACAYACNSYNQNTLSQALNIVFLVPARLGDVLVAEARESARSGRTSTYEIQVTGTARQVVAVAQAQCRAVKGQMIPDAPKSLA